MCIYSCRNFTSCSRCQVQKIIKGSNKEHWEDPQGPPVEEWPAAQCNNRERQGGLFVCLCGGGGCINAGGNSTGHKPEKVSFSFFFLFDMQMLEGKTQSNINPRHKITHDNSPKSSSVERTLLWEETQLKVGQLEEELVRMKANAGEEMGKTGLHPSVSQLRCKLRF